MKIHKTWPKNINFSHFHGKKLNCYQNKKMFAINFVENLILNKFV